MSSIPTHPVSPAPEAPRKGQPFPRLSVEEATALDHNTFDLGGGSIDGEHAVIEARPSHWMVPLRHAYVLLLGLVIVLVALGLRATQGTDTFWLTVGGLLLVFGAFAGGLHASMRDRYMLTPTRLLVVRHGRGSVREQMRLDNVKDCWNDDAAAGASMGLGTLAFAQQDGEPAVIRWRMIDQPHILLGTVQKAVESAKAQRLANDQAMRAKQAEPRSALAGFLANATGVAAAFGAKPIQPAPTQTPTTNPATAPRAAQEAPVAERDHTAAFKLPPLPGEAGWKQPGTPGVEVPTPVASVSRVAAQTVPPIDTGERTIVVGLVGGIGAGKSAVAKLFGELGCLVIDADKDAKAVLDRPEIQAQLKDWWGPTILHADGTIDRKRIAEIVFASATDRERLEGLVHPLVKADRAALINRMRDAGKAGVVIDAPLLFEAGSDKECDAVLFVEAPTIRRMERVRERGWDVAELVKREAAQLPLEEKRKRSHITITNNGDLDQLRQRVGEAWLRLREGVGKRKVEAVFGGEGNREVGFGIGH